MQQDIRVQDVTKLHLEAVWELMKTPPIKDVTPRPEALEQTPEQPPPQQNARDLGAPDNTLAVGVQQPDHAPDPAAPKKERKPARKRSSRLNTGKMESEKPANLHEH